jgi:hypothetical protein
VNAARPLSLALLAVIVASGCVAEAPSGSQVAIEVAPLDLPGITAADYVVTVRSSNTEVVWSRSLSSGRYGDGGGSLSYVGPCDADRSPNTVELALASLSDGDGALVAGVDFANPAPTGDPLRITVDCTANTDTPVRFELTVVRAAAQGFFDTAISFSDLFCSAKLDCEGAPGVPLELLTDPITGARSQTAVLGFACTAGAGQDTWLHMDTVEIACATGPLVTVDPGAGPGQLDPPYAGANTELLFQTAVYRGSERLPGFIKGYWNVALGLNTGAFTTLGPCTLSASATASEGPLSGGATPSGVRYPYVHWERPLVAGDGSLACARHAVNDGTGVAVAYTATTGHAFAASWDADPDATLPAAPTLLTATPSVEAVPSTIGLTFSGVAGATGYTATCAAAGAESVTVTASAQATTATLTGLVPGVTYSCTVSSDYGVQLSAPSNPLAATPTSTEPLFSSPYATTGQGDYATLRYPGSRDGVFFTLGTQDGAVAFSNPVGAYVVANVSDPLRSDAVIVSTPAMATDRGDNAGRINDDDGSGLTVTWVFRNGITVTPQAYWIKFANFGAGTTLEGFNGVTWETLRTWPSATLLNSWGESWGMLAPSGPLSAIRLVVASSGSGWHSIEELELFGDIAHSPTGTTIHPGELWITADNNWVLWVDGALALDSVSGLWDTERVTIPLATGTHTLALRTRNTGTSANPAAMIAELGVDGGRVDRTGVTGTSWKVSTASVTGWEQPGFSASGWSTPAACSTDFWSGAPTDLRARGAKWVADSASCWRNQNTYLYFRLTLAVD